MPALKRTDHVATITWLGTVADRSAALAAVPRPRISLSLAGPDGDSHAGLTRLSCSRVTGQYRKGTEIRNTRQVTILSAEELAATAAAMGLETLDPAWVGATVVLAGLPDLSHLPPSSRLQADSGATLVVDMENRPCHLPATEIDADPRGAGRGKAYRAAARGRRGVTAWVERAGSLSLGERVRLRVPDQPAWTGTATSERAPA